MVRKSILPTRSDVVAVKTKSTYRTDTNAPNAAKIPPATGKYMTLWLLLTKHPPKRAMFTPKHAPGKIVGSITPRDIPTAAARIARVQRTTTAKFRPTGKNMGSRKA